MVRRRAASGQRTGYEEQRKNRSIRQLPGPAQRPGIGVVHPEWPQPQVWFSELLGTLQPNGMGERGSVSNLPERRSSHRNIVGDTSSMEGPPERGSRGLRPGCVDL